MKAPQPAAIVLAGTHPHVPLIENLKRRGYRVVLVDYLAAPPAARVADEHLRISTLDPEAVLDLARTRQAALVIATCVDRANMTAAYVAEQLGLPAPYSHATAALIANKLTMKQRMVEAGVPTPAFRVLTAATEAESLAIEFPLVAKPLDCGGSKGVRKAADRQELRVAIDEAFKVTREARIIVERFCSGVEVSADCVVQDGVPRILMLRQKYIRRGGVEAVLSAYASVSPPALTSLARARIRGAIAAIVRGFALRTTALLVQFMVDGDDVQVIEFAPRVGGGLNYRLVRLHTGVDIVDVAIDAFIGRPFTIAARPEGGYLAANHVYTTAGCFGEVKHHERLLADGVVDEFYIHKARGAQMGASLASSERIASFLVRADSAESLLRRTREAFEKLDVLDVEGRSMMRRDTYLDAL